MPEILLTFERDGKTVHKETSGFKGKDCESLTEFLDQALGATDLERIHTREYYEGGDTNERQRVR